jgi:hypothetical protein
LHGLSVGRPAVEKPYPILASAPHIAGAKWVTLAMFSPLGYDR